MKAKWVLSVVVVFLLLGTSSHVTFAAVNGSTSVYDAIQKPTTSTTQKVNKSTPPKTQQMALPNNSAGGTFLTFLKLFLALGVVLLLIYLTYRFLGKRTRAFQSIGHIRNLGGVAIGPSKSVQLIKVGDEVLVLGVGENINLLKQVEDEAFLETLLLEPEPVTMKPAIGKVLEWAKEASKNKSKISLSKGTFKNQLEAVLKERGEGMGKVTKKETGHE